MPDLARSDMPIVLVCLTDKRSAQAAADLAAAGIRDVAVLRGGMRAWRGG
jgi:rhodanese-related sulfurtransferase